MAPNLQQRLTSTVGSARMFKYCSSFRIYFEKTRLKNTPPPTWCTRDQLKFHWILLYKTKDPCRTFANASENIHSLLKSKLQLKPELKLRGAFVCLFLVFTQGANCFCLFVCFRLFWGAINIRSRLILLSSG